jgi:diadenylate cyclase
MNSHKQPQEFLNHCFTLADTVGVEKILIQTDSVEDLKRVVNLRNNKHIIWLTTNCQLEQFQTRTSDEILSLQLDSIRGAAVRSMGLILAVLRGVIKPDETILCLYNSIADTSLDSLTLTNPKSRLHIMKELDLATMRELIAPEVFVRLINILSRFAIEGREGTPIGTIIILGEPERMKNYIQQFILNPCKGHREVDKNVLNDSFVETFRELAALDGAFIVNRLGVVDSAASYLTAPGKTIDLRPGLGARHAAAAAMTSKTESVAMVLSQSSGNITVFYGGNELFEIEIYQEREHRFS